MLRPDLRDLIRWEAQIPGGDDPLASVINHFIQEETNRRTALRKYSQCFFSDQALDWSSTVANHQVLIPSNVQHYDRKSIYYYPADDFDNRVRLVEWSRWRESVNGTPTQWREQFDADDSSRAIQVSPYSDLDTDVDTIHVDVWKIIQWTESLNFPIDELIPVITQACVKRLVKADNVVLYKLAKTLEDENYIAASGLNP